MNNNKGFHRTYGLRYLRLDFSRSNNDMMYVRAVPRMGRERFPGVGRERLPDQGLAKSLRPAEGTAKPGKPLAQATTRRAVTNIASTKNETTTERR